MKRTTFTYFVGSDLEDIELWVRANGDLIDFTTGYTFSVPVQDKTGTNVFTKTSNITGGAGSGLPGASGASPNVTIAWDVGADLDTLDAGRYLAELQIIRTADSKVRKRQFVLELLSEVAP